MSITFPKYFLAGIILIFFFLFIKEYLEILGSFNYYLYFLPTFLMLLISYPFQFLYNFKASKLGFMLAVFFVIYLFKDLLFFDLDGVLEQVNFFIGAYIVYRFSIKYPITTERLKLFLVLFFLLSIISVAISSRAELSLIPSYLNNYKIIVNSTHFFGKVLIFILLGYMWVMLEKQKYSFRLSDYLILFFLVSLGFWAGSRITFLVSVFLIFSLIYYRKRTLGYGSFILAMFLIISVYIAPVVLNAQFIPSFLESWSKFDGRADTSAGRTWLQLYHIDLFKNNLIFGVEASLVDFQRGDLIDGVRAQAASESQYTKYLAREGLFGVIKILFFLFAIVYPILKNNLIGFLIAVSVSLMSTVISATNTSYSFFYIFYIWLYFSSIFYKNLEMKSMLNFEKEV